ncbi:MAG: phosphoribosyl-ATP diphosphatase [Candidatus Bathyarchaeia archaeon]
MSEGILTEVYRVIERRRDNPSPDSYVSKLIGKGLDSILAKVQEESDELITAAREEGASEIVHEATDLIFHTLVLLAAKGIKLEEVYQEFRRRRR